MDDISIDRYFPAIVCGEHDSPIGALLELCVPQDEARDLVTATWCGGHSLCVLTTIDGGPGGWPRFDPRRGNGPRAMPFQNIVARPEAKLSAVFASY